MAATNTKLILPTPWQIAQQSTISKNKTPSKPKTAKKPKFDHSGDEVRLHMISPLCRPLFSLQSSPAREEGKQPESKVLQNAEGDKYVDLGKKKRATVRPFKGQSFRVHAHPVRLS